jgi:Cys-rich protein (TIGR01571 family)
MAGVRRTRSRTIDNPMNVEVWQTRDQWEHTLFGCWEDKTSCLIGTVCPYVLFGMNYSKLNNESCFIPCAVCFLSTFLCTNWIIHTVKRRELRSKCGYSRAVRPFTSFVSSSVAVARAFERLHVTPLFIRGDALSRSGKRFDVHSQSSHTADSSAPDSQ